MRSIIACAFALLSVGAFADNVVGNGRVEMEKRSVPAFSSISVAGSGALSGSGGTFLMGKADRVDITMTGSAELGARGFAAGDARIVASGSSRMEIRGYRRS